MLTALRGLRGRLLLIGTVGLAVGFGLAGFALVTGLRLGLQHGIDTDARATARTVAGLVEDGVLPRTLPVAGGQYVQVLDGSGRVQAASLGADLLTPYLDAGQVAAVRRGDRVIIDGSRLALTGPVWAVGVAAGGGTVVVAAPLGETEESVVALRRALWIAYPLMLLALVLVAWRVMGAALRPVEALRRGAERITGAATEERLPLPGAEDEIHRLAVTLNGMLDRLAAARLQQRAFVADAAHELRSPLASLRTQIEVSQRLDEPVSDVADDLLAEVDRLSRIVDDLLLLARAEDDPRSADGAWRPVPLRALLTAVADRAGSAQVAVVVAEGAEVTLDGDAEALRRAVDNLVQNAVRHARTRVVLSVQAQAGEVVVAVIDDGPGVPAEDRERVFARFTRLDDARARDSGGTGLGLAIVREIARRHGGTAVIEDARPGARVVLRLPAS